MDHLDVPQVGFILGGMRVDLTFPPLFKSVIVSTLDFGPNRFSWVWFVSPTTSQSRIILRVRSVPLTTGQIISGIFSEGFHLWTGSGPPACHLVFTIFPWNLGIVAVSDSTFQSWNHSVGPFF